MSGFRSDGYSLVPGFRKHRRKMKKWNDRLKASGMSIIRPGQMTHRLSIEKKRILAKKQAKSHGQGVTRAKLEAYKPPVFRIDPNEAIGVVGFGKAQPPAEGDHPVTAPQAEITGSH